MILLANFIHCYGADWNQRVLRRLVRSLAPRGRLVIKDYAISDDHLAPASAVWFRVSMALYGADGDVYPAGLVSSWLERSGLTAVVQHAMTADPESYVIIGTAIRRTTAWLWRQASLAH